MTNILQDWSKRWNKRARREVVFDPSDEQLAIATVSTGFVALDEILGPTNQPNKGVPRGRTTIIVGEPSSGKTLLTQLIIASAQRAGGQCIFFDVERTFDPRWFALTGVDVSPESLVVVRPTTLEQTFDMVCSALEEVRPEVLVVDSIPALVPKAILVANMEDQDFRGVTARKITEGVAKATQFNISTALIMINQLRVAMGVKFGNPESMPGGKGLRFHASLLLRCRRGKWLYEGGAEGGDLGDVTEEKDAKRIGFLLRIRAEKNKMSPPWQECDLKAYFTGEIDPTSSLVHLALQRGIIEQGNVGYFKVPGGDKLVHGRTALETLVKGDEVLRQTIVKRLATSELHSGIGAGLINKISKTMKKGAD